MAALVSELNGVKIYVSESGQFYCNCINNSDEIKEATFKSLKMDSIVKAIGDFNSPSAKVGEKYYAIDTYNPRIKELVVKNTVGTRLFFTDGTSSLNYGTLYTEEILKNKFISDFSDLEKEVKAIDKKLEDLRITRGEKIELLRKLEKSVEGFKRKI